VEASYQKGFPQGKVGGYVPGVFLHRGGFQPAELPPGSRGFLPEASFGRVSSMSRLPPRKGFPHRGGFLPERVSPMLRLPPRKGFPHRGGFLPERVSSVDEASSRAQGGFPLSTQVRALLSSPDCTYTANSYLYDRRSEEKSSQLWREVSAGSVLAKHQATLTRCPGPQLRNP